MKNEQSDTGGLPGAGPSDDGHDAAQRSAAAAISGSMAAFLSASGPDKTSCGNVSAHVIANDAGDARVRPGYNGNVERLLTGLLGAARTDWLICALRFPPKLLDWEPDVVSRAELAQAMNMALFDGLLARSENARRYVDDVSQQVSRSGGPRDSAAIVFDHGALRTVRWDQHGALPPGEAAFTRILVPLGFVANGRYPLDKLGMTGRAYAHQDMPDDIAQFFVSELHPERFSPAFQQAVTHVLASSKDPLTPLAVSQLWELQREGVLPIESAAQLLPVIVGAFERQHDVPRLSDYDVLLRESAEMAWIATEGNAFNHATDRVADVFALSDAQKALDRPMKAAVERSRSGRVFQTAYRADTVSRAFLADDGTQVMRDVPGSFYEFITRKREFDKATGSWKLDLRFDAGNAQGIFKMTANAADAANVPDSASTPGTKGLPGTTT